MSTILAMRYEFYEFFAGGGMARAGLGQEWECLFANDFDGQKGLAYQDNWGIGGELVVDDISNLTCEELPGHVDLAWASFPCQDLSLAGGGAGLDGRRSGTFFAFWNLVSGLVADQRAPRVVVLENVCGTLTARGGEDFRTIADVFDSHGYQLGGMIVDAVHFVPQSRPRLFLIGVKKGAFVDPALVSVCPIEPFHPKPLQMAFERLSDHQKENWVWYNVPKPKRRNSILADIIELADCGVPWDTFEKTQSLLDSMTSKNWFKVQAAMRSERPVVGAVYKRTRPSASGRTVRAEVRFDDVAGCLRTPNGGSSRQTILVVEGDRIRSRLLSTREAARLMGLPDTYNLPKNYNAAYHLMGDGVVVPVVRHLVHFVIEPLIDTNKSGMEIVAPPLTSGRIQVGN